MNHNKICFIYCTNEDELYAESLIYLQSLYVPEGFEVEVIAVTDANSMAEGYNGAMLQSDAKYKVYLHQDVFIVNKTFISDIVNLFTENPNLGLLGVAGSKTLPLNGLWRKSSKACGKILENWRAGSMELYTYGEVTDSYEKVQVVDGLILITQYDLKWREDVLPGWDLYDASQSLEFQRAGYHVGVVAQIEPWCVHDCGLQQINMDEQLYKAFFEEYENDLWPYSKVNQDKYPLVSVLIPAYNHPDLLRDALQSVLDQTYPHIEIIIGDDSTNDKVEQFIQPYLAQYKQITYFKNIKTRPDYGYQNMVNCLKRSNGQYVNFLNHDDLFHSEKIERMMRCFLENPDVRLVTSARQPFKDGSLLPMEGSFTKLFDKDTMINGHELCRIVISNLRNLIGEPSIVLFDKKFINADQLNYFNNVRPPYVGDLANWFTLLQHGDAVYIADTLTFVRIHSNQNTTHFGVLGNSLNGWFTIVKQSYLAGIIHNTEEYKKILNKWLNKYTPIPDIFVEKASQEQREQLSKCFKEAIDTILFSSAKE